LYRGRRSNRLRALPLAYCSNSRSGLSFYSVGWSGVSNKGGADHAEIGAIRFQVIIPAELSLSYAKRLDDLTVTIDVFPFQIIKEAPALPDQFQQPAPCAEILGVFLQVSGDGVDPLGKKGYLDFRGAGV
jgi:hypothetical protein